MESFSQEENENVSERIIDDEIQIEVEANAWNRDIAEIGGIVDVMIPADALSFERSINDTSEAMKSRGSEVSDDARNDENNADGYRVQESFHFQEFILTFYSSDRKPST